jgi:hypothetical protein
MDTREPAAASPALPVLPPLQHAAPAPAPATTGLHIEHLQLHGSRDATLAPRFAQALQSALGAAGWPAARIGRLTLDVSGIGTTGGPSLEALAQQVARQLASRRAARTPGGPE